MAVGEMRGRRGRGGGEKHGALRPQKPLRLIKDREVRGSGILYLTPQSRRCHHRNGSALTLRQGSCVSHFNVSVIVWAKSHDIVHKPHFLKRKESRRESNRSPSLPLGHTAHNINNNVRKKKEETE